MAYASISRRFNLRECLPAMYYKNLPTQRKRWLTALAGGLMNGAGCVMESSHAAAGWMKGCLKASAGRNVSQSVLPTRSSWNRNARRCRTDEQKRLRYDDAATVYFQACT